MQKAKTVSSHRYFSISAGVAGIPIVLVGIGGLIPLVYLLTKAFSAEATALIEIVFRWRNAKLFLNTLLLTAGVLTLDLLIATPAAWLTSRVNLKGKRLFTVLCALPLAIPGYVMAYALLALGGNTGIVAQLFGTSIPRLSGYWGALLALSAYTSPYLFLNLRTALLGLDPSLEESARSLGYRYYETFFRVILPQLRPAFYASGLLISLHVLGDFGVVSLMRYETFSYALYTEYMLSFEHIYAAWLALMLLAFTGCLLYLEAKLLNKVVLHRAGRGTSRQSSQVQLGAWHNPAYIYLSLLAFVTVVVPTGAVLLWMFRGFNTSALESLLEALIGSLSIAIPAGILCALLAVPFAYIDVRYPSQASKALARVAYIVYAIPPLAFALSLIFFCFKHSIFYLQDATCANLCVYLHFLAEAIGTGAKFALPSLAELRGGSPLAWVFTHTGIFQDPFPNSHARHADCYCSGFLATMKELPLTFLLSPAGYETLALNVWSYTTEAMFAEAAPYALAILIFSGVFVGVLIRHEEQT